MMPLELLLTALQLMIFYKVARSRIWKSPRECTECVKVLYISATLAAVLTCVVVGLTRFSDLVPDVPVQVRAALFTVLTLYSLISYHTVTIFDTTRIKKTRAADAASRSQFN